jgi:predicted transglutaminase-like cysteine proteinase
MFEHNWSKSRVLSLLVAGSLAGVSAVLADPAMAGPARDAANAPQMAMGAAALPPIGFLDFCRRAPQDCAEPSGDLTDTVALQTDAMRRFWQTAFSSSAVVSPNTAPASLGASTATSLDQTARYDWSGVFAVRRAGLSAPAVANAAVLVGVDTASSVLTNPSDQPLSPVTPLSADLAGRTVVVAEDATAVSRDVVEAAGGSVDAVLSPGSLQFLSTPLTFDLTSPSTGTAAGLVQAVLEPVQSVETAQEFSLDRAGWRLVNGINRRVNRQIRRSADANTYGEEDYWAVPQSQSARGDCEDFVLAKRRALIDAGVPAAALSIAIVETRWGESHAVLLLASDRGEFILDSLSPWVTRWDRVDYAWRERQLPGRPFDWVQVAI